MSARKEYDPSKANVFGNLSRVGIVRATRLVRQPDGTTARKLEKHSKGQFVRVDYENSINPRLAANEAITKTQENLFKLFAPLTSSLTDAKDQDTAHEALHTQLNDFTDRLREQNNGELALQFGYFQQTIDGKPLPEFDIDALNPKRWEVTKTEEKETTLPVGHKFNGVKSRIYSNTPAKAQEMLESCKAVNAHLQAVCGKMQAVCSKMHSEDEFDKLDENQRAQWQNLVNDCRAASAAFKTYDDALVRYEASKQSRENLLDSTSSDYQTLFQRHRDASETEFAQIITDQRKEKLKEMDVAEQDMREGLRQVGVAMNASMHLAAYEHAQNGHCELQQARQLAAEQQLSNHTKNKTALRNWGKSRTGKHALDGKETTNEEIFTLHGKSVAVGTLPNGNRTTGTEGRGKKSGMVCALTYMRECIEANKGIKTPIRITGTYDSALASYFTLKIMASDPERAVRDPIRKRGVDSSGLDKRLRKILESPQKRGNFLHKMAIEANFGQAALEAAASSPDAALELAKMTKLSIQGGKVDGIKYTKEDMETAIQASERLIKQLKDRMDGTRNQITEANKVLNDKDAKPIDKEQAKQTIADARKEQQKVQTELTQHIQTGPIVIKVLEDGSKRELNTGAYVKMGRSNLSPQALETLFDDPNVGSGTGSPNLCSAFSKQLTTRYSTLAEDMVNAQKEAQQKKAESSAKVNPDAGGKPDTEHSSGPKMSMKG